MKIIKIIFKYLILLILGSTVVSIIAGSIFPANIASIISFLGGYILGGVLTAVCYAELSSRC